MKTLVYLLDFSAGTLQEKYRPRSELIFNHPNLMAKNQEFTFIDFYLPDFKPSGNSFDIMGTSVGAVDIIFSGLVHARLDNPGSDEYDEILEFESYLISHFPFVFILRMDNEFFHSVPLKVGDCWPLFPHSVERFYQWLSQADPERWTILNDQPRRTEGALEAMEELLHQPIRIQGPIPVAEAFAFTDWPEVRGDPPKNILPGLVIDDTVIQSFLGEGPSKSIDADLFHGFMELASAGRRLLQTGIANVIIASPPETFDAVLTIREEQGQPGETYQCATIKTDYLHHMFRILDRGTWRLPRLVVDLAQNNIDLRMFEAAFSLFCQEVIPKRIRSNSDRPHSGKIIAIFMDGKQFHLRTFDY